jgi:chromatin structure-remodeling complex subunit RSC1/2
MARLFEKARRFHTPCTELYGRVLVLQVKALRRFN